MTSPRVGVGEILDDGSELVSSVAAPWMGWLWLTSAPLRLAQAHLASRMVELGAEARQYGDYLRGLALGVAAAFLISLWGRAVFISACRRRLRGLGDSGPSPLRLPLGPFLTYVYAALLIEVCFYATCMSGVAVPLFVLLGGLAAAVFREVERPGLLLPFAGIARQSRQALPLVGLLLSFAAAFALAAVNLYFLFRLGLWLAGGVAAADTTRWTALLAPSNPRFLCVLLAGGWLAVEPYWLGALAVYVHKQRSRSTGEDLRLWFERLRGAALVAAGVLIGAPVCAQEPGLSVPAYADALREIQEHLEAGRLDEARAEARSLDRLEVEWGGERTATDSTVLRGLEGAMTAADARARAVRVRRLIAALAVRSGTEGAADPRPEDLGRLALAEGAGRGGEVGPVPIRALSMPERIGAAMRAAYEWLARRWRTLRGWLDRLRPRRAPAGPDAGATAAAAIVGVAAATLLLVLLAVRTLRGARTAAVEEVESGQASSARDEDPLSREAGDWEKHARELGTAGRWREAVRAWYHAVLAGVFRAGLVHHQRGRTNWEYAARLAPDLPWRAAFLDLTRLFDREWYGRVSSDADAARECAQVARAILRELRAPGGPA